MEKLNLTNEQAIQTIQSLQIVGMRSGKRKLFEALQIAIAALESAEPKWIPVSERLPEIHQVVLLSLRSLDIEVGFRAETEPYFYCHGVDGCYVEPQNVLAWQPLPEPYKEGE